MAPASVAAATPFHREDAVDLVKFEGRILHVVGRTEDRLELSETPPESAHSQVDRIRIIEIKSSADAAETEPGFGLETWRAPIEEHPDDPPTPSADELRRWWDAGDDVDEDATG